MANQNPTAGISLPRYDAVILLIFGFEVADIILFHPLQIVLKKQHLQIAFHSQPLFRVFLILCSLIITWSRRRPLFAFRTSTDQHPDHDQ